MSRAEKTFFAPPLEAGEAEDLVTVAWEDLWERPLDAVRREFGVELELDPLVSFVVEVG